jgi:hypothetical protein
VKKADFENDDDDDDSEQYEIPDDLAASHTTKTAENYGVTIDVLKRLTAESLEIFSQVSYGWHKFLGLVERPSSQPSLKRKCVDAGGLTPKKRPKILPLNKAVSEVASEQALLKALRAVLRDDHAQFRTPQKKEAVRLAAAKETPLVAILPTGGGKSLVFMVPAMLSGSGVTIVVAPYAEPVLSIVILRNILREKGILYCHHMASAYIILSPYSLAVYCIMIIKLGNICSVNSVNHMIYK